MLLIISVINKAIISPPYLSISAGISSGPVALLLLSRAIALKVSAVVTGSLRGVGVEDIQGCIRVL
jgi:hypothetical protein